MDVRLATHGEDSISATVYAVVDRAAAMRPGVVAELAGVSLRLNFLDMVTPVRIEFRADEVIVGDDDGARADIEIRGTLPDVTAVIAAPLARGVPRPTNARGRAALRRLADGRVVVDGPIGLGRRVLRLLTLQPG